MDEASKCALQIRGFFWFWNSGSLSLQKFFYTVLKCPSEGKQKKERSRRFLELFKQFATEQKFTMTFVKLRAFQLTVKTVNAFVFFNFPSGPLSLIYVSFTCKYLVLRSARPRISKGPWPKENTTSSSGSSRFPICHLSKCCVFCLEDPLDWKKGQIPSTYVEEFLFSSERPKMYSSWY